MAKKNASTRVLSKQKLRRRKWITFIRMVRYGANNFTRNAWLTIAATAVMTITLLIVFVTIASRNILIDTIGSIRDKVDMSIYLQTDVKDEDATTIASELRKLSSVRLVTYISPDEAREKIAQQNKNDRKYLEALNEASNRNPGVLRVVVVDINDISQLKSFVDTNELLKANIDPNRAPSFAGEKRASIENIGRAAAFAERVGIIASLIFITISSLIIFNTIRMAIFNRKEEIAMMKLIGAEQSFIRGPFVVEAVVYGFFAALIASAIGFALLFGSAPTLESYDITIQPTIAAITYYAAFIVLIMISIGALIGIVSSWLATRRHLKL